MSCPVNFHNTQSNVTAGSGSKYSTSNLESDSSVSEATLYSSFSLPKADSYFSSNFFFEKKNH